MVEAPEGAGHLEAAAMPKSVTHELSAASFQPSH